MGPTRADPGQAGPGGSDRLDFVPEPDDKRDGSGGGWSAGLNAYAEYSVVAFVFPVAVAIGFFGGRWVGSLLGAPQTGAVLGALLGTAAGFYNLWQTLRRAERRDRDGRHDRDGEGRPG